VSRPSGLTSYQRKEKASELRWGKNSSGSTDLEAMTVFWSPTLSSGRGRILPIRRELFLRRHHCTGVTAIRILDEEGG